MPRFVLILLGTLTGAARMPAAEPIDAAYFENKIRPLFVTHCLSCHDAKKEKGGLQLTSRAAAVKGGDTGPALVPSDAAKSLLVAAVRYDGDTKMPPKGKLAAAEIAALEAWVAGGAPWPDSGAVAAAGPKGIDVKALAAAHWSFQPVKRPTVPPGPAAAPIDRFIRAKLSAAGLAPAPPADPRALVRRLYFDLIGLPPPPAAVEAFAADPSPAAYTKIVEELLASPHHGERWGRHWLDLVRYAETLGHEFDFDIPDAWRYRDYVIRAVNADLPYDQFLKEHVAGDLLPNPRRHPTEGYNESVIGTGYWLLGESKHSPVDVRQDQADRMDNMIDVFGKTFLGLTLACARCHDHKFDPLPAKDYYALYGALSSSRNDHAFLDDPAADLAVLAKLSPPAGPDKPAPPPTPALSAWRSESTSFEDFAPGWADRWFRSGAAFHAPGDSPHSGRATAAAKGVLRSATFTTSRNLVAVRVAGKSARVNLIVDNYQLIQDPIYGGLKRGIDHGEAFRWVTFDAARWKGQAAYLEFIDDGPGYVAVAEVRFADRPPPAADTGSAALPPNITDPAAKAIEARLSNPRRAPALADGTGRDEPVFVRGNPKTPGEVVPRRFLEVFAGPAAPGPAAGSGRLELAKALTDPANTLVARVLVNRVWLHHFGEGLVPTPDDFGRQGRPPTHPELLDWLASEFVSHGWSVKYLHRLILQSETYRQSATRSAKGDEADPLNRLLHRANVRRLEAEAVRDAILAVAGTLDRTAGGPGVPPYLAEHVTGRGKPSASGPVDGAGRRSVYLQVRRNFPNALLAAFDYPTPFTTIGRRGASNVPAQALVMLNNPFVRGQAEKWAARACTESADPAERARRMVAAAYSRPAVAQEVDALTAFAAGRRAAGESEAAAWAAVAHALFNAKAFVFVE